MIATHVVKDPEHLTMTITAEPSWVKVTMRGGLSLGSSRSRKVPG